MIYQSYKGRSIDFNHEVKIYKNLHNGLFSVMQFGLVVAHVESFTMFNVTFKVSESGRQRVIKEKQKNIHAFIIGTLSSVNAEFITTDKCSSITYNPYKASNFYYRNDDTFTPVKLPSCQVINAHCKKGIYCTY